MGIKSSFTEFEPQSMIPAIGWRAVFTQEAEEKAALTEYPLVAFVMVKATDVTLFDAGPEARNPAYVAIIGYIANADGIIEPAEENTNFAGYLAPGEALDVVT